MSDEIERPPRPELGPTLSEAEERALLERSRPGPPGPLDRLRELPTPARGALAVLAVVTVLGGGLLAVQGLRPDLAEARPALLLLGPVVAAGCAWIPWALSSYARPNPHPGRRALAAAVGVVAVLLLAALPLWPGVHVPDAMRPGIDQRCATWAAVNGAAVLGAFLLFDRHAGARLFATLSATAAATSLAFAVQTLNCPCIDLAHVLLAHAAAGALAGLALVGIRLAGGASRG